MSKDDIINGLYRIGGEKISEETLDFIKLGEIPLNICALINDEEFYWTAALNINAIFKIHKKTFKIEYIGSFPGEDMFKGNISFSGIRCGHKIYFAPYDYRKIAVYDIVKKDIYTIDFEYPMGEYNPPYSDKANFSDVVAYKNYIFFIPGSYPAIIKLDVNTDEITYISNWVSDAECYIKGKQRLHWTKAITIGNRLYAGGIRSNVILELDMDSCVSVVHEVGDENYAYGSICSDGEKIWMSPKFNHGLIVWDIESRKITEINNYPNGYQGCDYGYGDICIGDEKVWLFPVRANQTLYMGDKSVGELAVAEEFQGSYTFAKAYENIICTFETNEHMLIFYDTISGDIIKESMVCSGKVLREFLYQGCKNKMTTIKRQVFEENRLVNLESYMKYVFLLSENNNEMWITGAGE